MNLETIIKYVHKIPTLLENSTQNSLKILNIEQDLLQMQTVCKIPILTANPASPVSGEMWILKTIAVPSAPSVTINDITNKVIGMTTDMEYNLDNIGYVTYIDTIFNEIDFSGDHTLLVRYKSVGETPCSLATTLRFTTNTLVFDTLNVASPVGLEAFSSTGRKTAISFTPTENMILDNAQIMIKTDVEPYHTTATPITISLCTVSGAGIPNSNTPLESVTVDGTAINDTIFTINPKFVNNIMLNANTKYCFVLSTTNTGTSYYYTAGVVANSIAGYGSYTYKNSPWTTIEETHEVNMSVYKR